MILKCKKSKRFLCKTNFEEIIALLEKMGIEMERPLEIRIPCKNCKKIEIYDIYKDHYVFKGNDEK